MHCIRTTEPELYQFKLRVPQCVPVNVCLSSNSLHWREKFDRAIFRAWLTVEMSPCWFHRNNANLNTATTQIAKFMGPTWGPPGSYRPQMGLMLAPWTLLSVKAINFLYLEHRWPKMLKPELSHGSKFYCWSLIQPLQLPISPSYHPSLHLIFQQDIVQSSSLLANASITNVLHHL